jgi:hypothetical protein
LEEEEIVGFKIVNGKEDEEDIDTSSPIALQKIHDAALKRTLEK